MKKTSTLNNKLKSYSAMAGTLVAAANTANAQIVYTDITPDTTVNTGGAYDLDLDNDGNVDFQFQLQHGTYMYGTFAIPYDLGMLAPEPGTGNAIDTLGGAVAHNLNDPIGSSLLWVDDAAASYQILGAAIPLLSYAYGNFLGQSDKYLGLRFKIAGNDHYGWARLDMDASATSFVIKDYAYDATAGNSIPAGATVTGINENSHALANAVSVYSADKTITVNMKNAAVAGTITVTNTLGQVVATTSITNAVMTIPMTDANTGIYFVTINQDAAKTTSKVIIK